MDHRSGPRDRRLGCVATFAWLSNTFQGDSWRVEVVSIEGSEVCVRSLPDEDGGGFLQPTCRRGSREPGASLSELRIGDRVQVEVHHPSLDVVKVVECPE